MIVINILRHAHAPKIEGVPEIHRPVSQTGLEQCLRLRSMFEEENFRPELILHSPISRAAITAVASSYPTQGCPIISLKELFTPEGADGEIINAAFAAHQYEIDAYSTDAEVLKALNRWGKLAADTVIRQILAHNSQKVLIATHAIFANWLAKRVCYMLTGEHKSDPFLHTPVGECGRFFLSDSDARYVPLSN